MSDKQNLTRRKLIDTHRKSYLTLIPSHLRPTISVFHSMKADTWYIRSIIKQKIVCKIITIKPSQSGPGHPLPTSSSPKTNYFLQCYSLSMLQIPVTSQVPLLRQFLPELSIFTSNCFEDRNQHLIILKSPRGPGTASAY